MTPVHIVAKQRGEHDGSMEFVIIDMPVPSVAARKPLAISLTLMR